MDRNRVNYVAEVESAAGQSVGLLELWHGASQIVWYDAAMCSLGAASGQFRTESAATLAPMVLGR